MSRHPQKRTSTVRPPEFGSGDRNESAYVHPGRKPRGEHVETRYGPGYSESQGGKVDAPPPSVPPATEKRAAGKRSGPGVGRSEKKHPAAGETKSAPISRQPARSKR